ncbi:MULTISPECIES: hypothetical protein [Nocardia]|uniref:hypothetical protein n=1 Tax=Nocardia TaxID=1817 RepID=UPI002457B16C|nr:MULTISPECIES: hypothetical protein [Nocardia]
MSISTPVEPRGSAPTGPFWSWPGAVVVIAGIVGEIAFALIGFTVTDAVIAILAVIVVVAAAPLLEPRLRRSVLRRLLAALVASDRDER